MKVKYPQFDGSQSCSQIGTEFYYSKPTNKKELELAVQIKNLCSNCTFKDECLEWALHYEKYGIWGGTTEDERKSIRKKRGITVRDPAFML